jgi:hypothetical protein
MELDAGKIGRLQCYERDAPQLAITLLSSSRRLLSTELVDASRNTWS